MEHKKEELPPHFFRHLIHHEFLKQRPNKPNASEAGRQISSVYGEISPSYEYCKKQRLKPAAPGNMYPEQDPPPEEVMLCVFWDTKLVISWELLGEKDKLNADRNCKQLRALAEILP
jgi:hypothetical protein